MSNRRGKSQARRSGSNGTLPGWAWLVIGVLVTLLAVLLVPRLLRGEGDGFFKPKPNPDAMPTPVAEGEAIAPDAAPAGGTAAAASKPDKTNFDFYKLLPGKEVEMSDAELAASAKAEAEARARAAKSAAAATTGKTDALPDPVDTSAAPATTAPAATVATTTPVAPTATARPNPPATTPAATSASGTTTVATTATPEPAAAKPAASAATANTDAHYILQAGAFGASGDAEAMKAKIALLGLNARVESAQINGKTVYRVRMGPYGSASELAEAKGKLTSGGLPAMAVKAK